MAEKFKCRNPEKVLYISGFGFDRLIGNPFIVMTGNTVRASVCERFETVVSFAEKNSAKNNHSVRCCLSRNASCGSTVINNKEMISQTAGKTLAVGGGDAGAGIDVQFQLILSGEKVAVKIGNHHIFRRFGTSDKGGLILGRIYERHRQAAVIKSRNPHAGAQGGIVHHIGAGG